MHAWSTNKRLPAHVSLSYKVVPIILFRHTVSKDNTKICSVMELTSRGRYIRKNVTVKKLIRYDGRTRQMYICDTKKRIYPIL